MDVRTGRPKGTFPGEISFNTSRDVRYKATGEFRAPKKGEYFLSGAVVTAYYTPNDLLTEFWIAKPVDMVVCACCGGTGKVEQPE